MSNEPAEAQLQVRFVTKQEQYAVQDSPYAIQSNVQSIELNNLVNALLKETIPSLEKAVEFDFLVCGELLCTPLSEHLQEKGVSAEETLEIEYLERFPAPTPQDCLMHDDWVSTVQAYGNWKRKMRPTLQQQEALADFLTLNPGIAKGLMRSARGKFETKKKWEEIASTINALGGAHKDGQGWAKYGADKKCALKKTCAQYAESLKRTSGGPADLIPVLTPMDQHLVAVMGGAQFAAGDSQTETLNLELKLEDTENSVPEIPPPMQAAGNSVPEFLPSMQAAETRTHSSSPLRQRSPLRTPSPHSRLHTGRTVLDQERERFRAIEAEPVNARAFSELAGQMPSLTASVEALATATREGAQTIADALNRIAESVLLLSGNEKKPS